MCSKYAAVVRGDWRICYKTSCSTVSNIAGAAYVWTNVRNNQSLKTADCVRQFSSYRASFELAKDEWTTVRLPWSAFGGFGPGAADNPLDPSTLRRIGVVAFGRAMDATLALSSIRFMRDQQGPVLAA